MGLFSKKKSAPKSFDRGNTVPVIRASICTGEQVAGFRNLHTGAFEEVMLLRNSSDLEEFKQRYGITGSIEKIY